MLKIIVTTIHISEALALIALVLLHSGKGGGLSDMFGGGGGALHGNAMVEKNLDRLTVAAAVGFTITNVLLVLVH